MKNYKLISVLLSALLISACTSEPDDDLQDSIVEATAISNFDPGNSVIPFPNDLLFAGTTDGTLNIPVANPADLSDPQVALNGVDGFSTVAPFTTGFTGPILASSLNGSSVRVYPVNLLSTPGGPIINFSPQLVYGVEYVATVSSVDSSGSTLAIVPLIPLDPKSSYYVVITNSLRSSDGNPMGASGAYTFAKLNTPLEIGGVSQFPTLTDAEAVALEPLRQLVNNNETGLVAFDATVSTAEIIMSWSFTTQSISDVLTQVRFNIRSAGVPASSLALAATGLDVSPLGAANIYVGTVDVPYYLDPAASVNDPTPLGSFWQTAAGDDLTHIIPGRLSPASTGTRTIPLMVSVPIAGGPTYPIVIFQHGITTNRATILAVADAFALAGFAVASIDLPLHGLTGNETDGTQFYRDPLNERTFDLDLVTQNPATGDITAAAPDGITDSSGRHYINLTNLLNTRDNVRQSVSDLFALTYAVSGLNAAGNTFDVNNIYFLGHSLGASVGTTFAALEPTVKDTVFVFGGGSLPKVLDGSASFSPSIVAGLAAAGVNKGTPDYESFLGAAQTVVDSGDPVNFATILSAKMPSQGILFFEMVGGNTSPSDLTFPNTVPDGNDSSNTVPAPLAGTEPLLDLMGLTQVNSDQAGAELRHSVKLVVGNHGSLLSAAADPFNSAATNAAVRTEIQSIAATFVASDGAIVDVTDDTLLQAP